MNHLDLLLGPLVSIPLSPMPVVDVGGVGPLLNDPPGVALPPLGHALEQQQGQASYWSALPPLGHALEQQQGQVPHWPPRSHDQFPGLLLVSPPPTWPCSGSAAGSGPSHLATVTHRVLRGEARSYSGNLDGGVRTGGGASLGSATGASFVSMASSERSII